MPAVVMTSSASVPASWHGFYRNVRVVEMCHWDLNVRGWHWRPASIRSREVIRVLRDLGPLRVGKTERGEYQRALAECEAWALAYNSAGDVATAEQLIGAGGSA